MSKLAFLFPGQASQYSGMGRDLAENFPESRAVFDEADAALGFPDLEALFRRPGRGVEAYREHPAGDSDGFHRGIPRTGLSRHHARFRGRSQPRRIFGAGGCRLARFRNGGEAGTRTRPLICRKRCLRAKAPWPQSSAFHRRTLPTFAKKPRIRKWYRRGI